MTRRETIARILSARTRAEILKARGIRSDYLDKHPDDDEVLETGNYLIRREEALDLMARDQVPLPVG